MSKLPENWTITTLAEVATWGSGGTPSRANLAYFGGGIPWIKTGELGKPLIECTEETISELALAHSSAKIFPRGSVAIAMYGATIGKVSVLGIDAATNQACAVGIPDKNLTTCKFLYHYLCSQKDAFIEAGKGAAQPNISQGVIKNWSIPLPPLNEQIRIADKLDALLARVDACKERLDRIPLIFKRFRQAVLDAATSGQLTADWQTSRESAQWQRVSLSEICLSITDGDHQAPPQTERGVPFITIAAINDGRLRIDKATRFVPSAYFEDLKASRKPEMGDILFSVTGSIAISALVDTSEPFIFQRHIAILKPDLSRISSSFLRYALETEDIKRQALSVATGTAQLTIPLSGLRAFIIDIPARDEQDEIVSRVEALFAYADRLEARYQSAYTQVELLTPTLLAKAFRGELVPQDPKDESALVLLERIRAERAAQLAKPKTKASRKPTMTKMTKESVKEAIRQLPKDKFSFDELRENLTGDYDSLKDILFALLSEAEPSLTQVFDHEERAMRFFRAGK